MRGLFPVCILMTKKDGLFIQENKASFFSSIDNIPANRYFMMANRLACFFIASMIVALGEQYKTL